jgi:hypothetical protein
MSAQSESETISWQEALGRLSEKGELKKPADDLVRAILDGSVEIRPCRALPLSNAINKHLFDLKTGEWRISLSDRNPMVVRVVRSGFKRHFQISDTGHGVENESYFPQFLALAHQAIEENAISDANQPKHETLFEWFRKHEVAGKQVSKRIAEALATIVRRPDRMQGGAHRARRKG